MHRRRGILTFARREECMWRPLSALSIVLIGLCGSAAAQSWPTKPIRVIVPFSPGSAPDIVGRTVLEQVAKQLGQPIVIENRLGAGGTLGMGAVAKAAPDGYTLLVHTTTHAVTASTYANPGYDTRRDFAGVTGLASVPNVLIVAPNKYQTVKDLVAAAKVNPGAMNYATVGPGSAAHLNAERFLMASGIKAQQVPFKGGPEALTEIMAGRIDFYFVPLPPARGLLDAGKVAVLAVSGSTRASALPDVPTTIEAGFPDSDYNFWVGMFAPVATPRAIVDKLNAETVKALAMPSVKEKLSLAGGDPMPMTPAGFDAFVKKEIDVNAALVKAAGIEVN
jgi:tripartite-type tricarboxylate transporter receptor subunit TctC